MGYSEKRDSKVVLAKLLSNAGFEIYGYKEDESDCMTDYYSPADWDGIATKGKYIAVVDNKGKSGFEILMNKEDYANYMNKASGLTIKDRERIESLERLAKDRAATTGEAQNALAKIEAIRNKKNDICEVIAQYKKIDFPATNFMIFIYDTEQNCIVYKDNCLTQYDIYDFQFKINDGKIISRTFRDYQTNEETNDLSDETIKLLQDTLETFKNLDFIKQGYYVEKSKKETTFDYVEKDNQIIDKDTFMKGYGGFLRFYEKNGMGAYRFKAIKSDNSFVNNKTYQSCYKCDIDAGMKFYTQIVVAKNVWVKANRGIAIETNVKADEVKTETNYKINHNEKLNGIEISFDKKPSQDILDNLKKLGMRWSSFNKVWYIKNNDGIENKILKLLKTA